METPDLVAIGCFPVDCEENRTFVQGLGVWPDSIPWMFYPGSVQGECQAHHGPVWVGPKQQELIRQAEQAGNSPLVICHICTIIMAKETGADIDLVKLSSSEAIEPRNN